MTAFVVGAKFTELAFYCTILMSFMCFFVFCFLAWSEVRQKQLNARGKHYESLPDAGDLAVKFGTAGLAPSSLACAVVFMVIATAIALTLDERSVFSLFK